jgi:hypothetical protein
MTCGAVNDSKAVNLRGANPFTVRPYRRSLATPERRRLSMRHHGIQPLEA